jgi:D-alanine-D-alanine ligase
MRERVVLLHDAAAAAGRPDAADTLVEAGAIGAALAELGHAVSVLPVGLDLAAFVRALGEAEPSVVFNLVESLDGRGELIGVVPALLESLGVAYTGCTPAALAASSNKLAAKRALANAAIPTPPLLAAGDGRAGPWIVKAVAEHASLGLDDGSVVSDAAAVDALLAERRARFGGRWFAERYVPGRELNVAVLASPEGPRVLAPAEIRFTDFPPGKPAIVGYAAKWDTDSFEYRNTVRSFAVEAALAERAAALARRCWALFGLDGYARVDFRVDADGVPWVLEVNANPCLAPDAGFAAALATEGIGYATAIGWLVDDALGRAARAEPCA